MIFNSFKVEIIPILKSKISYFLLIMTTLYNYIIYNQRVEMNMPYEAVTATVFTIQATMLGFIIIGIYLQKKEENGNMLEVLKGINSAIFVKLIAKILVVISLIAIYLSFNFIILVVAYRTSYINYYYDVFKYMVIYWGLPFFIASLLGYLISSLTKGKMVYVLSIVIWLLLSPLNKELFSQMGVLGFRYPYEVSDFFNLLQNNPEYPVNATYGLNLEGFQIFKRSFIAVVVIMFNIFIIYKKKLQTKKNFNISMGCLSIICIFLGIQTFKNQQVITYGFQMKSVNRQEEIEYRDVKVNYKYKNFFKATEYNMDLDVGDTLKNKVEIKIESVDKANKEIHFLLDRGLNVDDIYLDGKRVQFTRDKDNLIVDLGKEVKSGNLTIEYEGITTPSFFANKIGIYLPNTYPWYPVISEYDSISSNSGIVNRLWRNYIMPKGEVKYKINLKDSTKIKSNLSEISKNVFEGNSIEGIYLLKGITFEKIFKERKIIHPFFIDEYIDGLENLNDEISKIERIINEDLGIDRKIKTVIIVDSEKSIIGNISNEGALIEDTLIIPAKATKNGIEAVLPSIISSMTNKNLNIDSSKNENIIIFDLAYSLYVERRLGMKEVVPEFNNYKENIEMNVEFFEENKIDVKEYIRVLNEIEKLINSKNISEQEKGEFFKKWYEEIKKNNVLDSNEILNLLKGSI